MLSSRRFDRRSVLLALASAAAGTALVACGSSAPAAPTPTPAASGGNAPAPTAAPATAATAPTATTSAAPATPVPAASTPNATPSAQAAAPAAQPANLAQVPRNKTWISVGVGGEAPQQFSDVQMQNPFLPGISRSGYQVVMEPLYYYNPYNTDNVCGLSGVACTKGEIPWLATAYKFNQDFTQLAITLRDGVEWSDGQPFTANDVAFTLNMLKDNAPSLGWSVDMKQWVKEAVALDPRTVQITLNNPNPRFMFSYFTFHEDVGVQIVPEHIFKGQDLKKFTNFDLAKGLPVVTGPYKLVHSDAQQKIWDLRSDWWGAKTGFHPLPAPQRLVFLPGYDEAKQVQMIINNDVDCTLSMQLGNIQAALARNPKVSSWSGNKPPYGYVDWWPTGLGFNDSKPPFDDPDIRWAINHAINRDQVVQVGYHGAGEKAVFPYPDFPALNTYIKGLSDILQRYPVDSFDLNKTAQLMQSKGYAKDQGGFWAKDGKRLSIVVITFPVEQDVTPVVVEQLRKGGFDASFKMPTDFGTLIFTGAADAFVFGHGGSVQDPYFTARLYQSQYSAPTGQPAGQPYRWKNDAYDKLVDQMGQIASDDPKLEQLFHQAMEIWVPQLPDIPLVQFYHRNPVNTTYWTNWPDANNPYINSANWHRTCELMILGLKPAG